MDENPYKSPAEEATGREDQPSGRMPVAGALLFGLALFVWLPMTIGTLASAVLHPEKDLRIKSLAAPFNGLMAALLFWAGRRMWRGRRPKDS
jgi:hypothetical protein